MQLGAYQHHAFLDWRLVVEDEQWSKIHLALNGAGIESMQAKWEEMFGVKEEVEEEKPKKPAKKRTTRKKKGGGKKTNSKNPKAKKEID